MYPPSTSRPCPNRYRHDNHHTERTVRIRAAQIEPEHEYDYRDEGNYLPEYADYDQFLDQDDVDLTFATDMWAVAVERADGLERKTGKCFNCRETGHYWRECPKPLKEDFKCLRDQPKQRQEELNGNGGPGKGGRVPQVSVEASGAGNGSGRTGPPIEDLPHPPYWNDDPCARWLGPSNVGYAYIDGC